MGGNRFALAAGVGLTLFGLFETTSVRAQSPGRSVLPVSYEAPCEAPPPAYAPRVVVELSPPEVVFQEPACGPVDSCPEGGKHWLFKRRHHHKDKAGAAATEAVVTYPTTIMPFQVPAVAVVPGQMVQQQSGCLTPAQRAAQLAFAEAEAKGNLAFLKEQERTLISRVSTLSAERAAATSQVAGTQAATTQASAQADLPMTFEQLQAKVLDMEKKVDLLLNGQAALIGALKEQGIIKNSPGK